MTSMSVTLQLSALKVRFTDTAMPSGDESMRGGARGPAVLSSTGPRSDQPATTPCVTKALPLLAACGSPRQVSSTVQLPKYVHRRTIWFTFRISIEIFREIKFQQKKYPDRNKVGNQKKSAEKPSRKCGSRKDQYSPGQPS